MLAWLRTMHGWIGLWGAVLGLLFGSTGILLNHGAVLPLAAAPAPDSTVQLPLPSPAPADPQALAAWVRSTLALAPAPSRVVAEPSRRIAWGARSLPQPPHWRASFASPTTDVQADYWVGNSYVTVTKSDDKPITGLVKLLPGAGPGIGWILLVDTLAGSIILLSLSGVALWALTNRRRALGVAIGLVSLLLAAGSLALAAAL